MRKRGQYGAWDSYGFVLGDVCVKVVVDFIVSVKP